MATNLQRFTSSHGSRPFATYVIVERKHLWQKCFETVTADSGKLCSFVLGEKKHEWKRSIAAPTKRDYCDCCRDVEHFRFGVERGKRFVNVHLHCIISNMNRISKMSGFPSLEKIIRTSMNVFDSLSITWFVKKVVKHISDWSTINQTNIVGPNLRKSAK